MKAAIFKGADRPLAIEVVADPEPGPDDLILSVKSCGICGSDLHMTEAGPFTIPGGAVMGHEFAGEIVGAGRNAALRWKIGTKATALPYLGCGRCAACLSGRGHRCASVTTLGLGQSPGAYAEFVKVGAAETLALPDAVSFREGAMIEPLAVGLHAVNAARLANGANVLVIGAGPIGLAVTLWARHFGARRVVVSDLAAARRELAGKLGATDLLDGSGALGDAFAKIAGAPPDAIFECVGAPGLIQECLTVAAPDTTIMVVGVCMKPDMIIPAMGIVKELTLKFVLAYDKADFSYAIDMIAAGRIDPTPMITHIVGFEAFASAFEALRKPQHQCKVMLEPRP